MQQFWPWALLVLGAFCILGGFALALRKSDGANSSATFEIPGGTKLSLSSVSQGVVFAALGIGLVYLGSKSLPAGIGGDTAPGRDGEPLGRLVAAAPIAKTPPATDGAIISVTYRRVGTQRDGEFRRSDGHSLLWTEVTPELAEARTWHQDLQSAPPGLIRLVDGTARIEIDPSSQSISYTDPGYPGFPYPQKLDDILSVKRE